MIDVLDFGAIPDGDGAAPTCNADQVEAALALGGDVVIPKGHYWLSRPVEIPSHMDRRTLFGEGDATKLRTTGTPVIRYPGEGYYGFALERLALHGDHSVDVPAVDCSPDVVTHVVGGALWSRINVMYFLAGWKLQNAQLCAWDDCTYSTALPGGRAFWVAPDAGSGQQSNANRVNRMRFAGPDAEVIRCDFSASPYDRASQWHFREPDVQFTGTVPPFTVRDADWTIEGGEFENNTGANLIVLTADDVRAASRTRIIGNILSGAGANGAGKIRSESAGVQQPYYCTLENNDAGAPSVPLLEFGTGQSGRSYIIANNQGGIVGRGGGYHIIQGGSDMLGQIEINGTVLP